MSKTFEQIKRENAERYPDPGTDPVVRLGHVLDVFAGVSGIKDRMAVVATMGVHGHDTGLTHGDLEALYYIIKKLAELAEEYVPEAVRRQAVEELRALFPGITQ